MYIAKTKDNKRIYINEALKNKGEEYFCTQCNGRLIIKNGTINVPHFAHKTLADCDSFSSDMSKWHRSWQEMFPEECREVVIEYEKEKHRADICIGEYIVEFQHSPISRDEFNRRCEFYTKAGYKLIWVFDQIEKYKDNIITVDLDGIHHWNHAAKFMCDIVPSKNYHNIRLFFQFLNENNIIEDCPILEQICWNNNGDFSEFVTNRCFSSKEFVNVVSKNEIFKSDIICEDNSYINNTTGSYKKRWQSLFPEYSRDIIIECITSECMNKELSKLNLASNTRYSLKADICIGDIIILFQDEKLLKSEFEIKNYLYTRANKKVIWVFKKWDEMNSRQIASDESLIAPAMASNFRYFWPPNTFESWKKGSNIELWFHLATNWVIKILEADYSHILDRPTDITHFTTNNKDDHYNTVEKFLSDIKENN